jgi:hypothetical protein
VELVLDVYRHFDYPDQMLALLARRLRLDRDDVVKEIGANGFRLLSKNDRITENQYM